MSNERKFACFMNGLPGAGKTTTNTLIQRIVADAGGVCLNVSFDKWIRKGVSFPLIAGEIHKEIVAFDARSAALKVAIIDLCNERGISSIVCDFDFARAGYRINTFTPNYYGCDFDGYRAWCLTNVLARPEPGADDKYALTPTTSSVATCVNVHNRKASFLARSWRCASPAQVEHGSLADVFARIKAARDRYACMLQAHSLERDVRTFMSFIY